MQPAVGQGALDDAGGTHPPAPLPAARSQMHFLVRYAQGQQMASARPGLLPLFPIVQPYAPAHPCGQFDDLGIGVAGASPGKSALLPVTTAAFTSAAEPVDFAVLCQLTHRVGLDMRFLFVGPTVSASLPPTDRLPFRCWLRVVI